MIETAKNRLPEEISGRQILSGRTETALRLKRTLPTLLAPLTAASSKQKSPANLNIATHLFKIHFFLLPVSPEGLDEQEIEIHSTQKTENFLNVQFTSPKRNVVCLLATAQNAVVQMHNKHSRTA
ncbi:MAG: hypothetical protein DRJ36_02710, partial [Thermoprotei archaeon]